MKTMDEIEEEVLECANRLHGMPYSVWWRLKVLIDKQFEKKKDEAERQLRLDTISRDEFSYY